MSTQQVVNETVAAAVLAALEERGMPKSALANRTGIPRPTLHRKLSGFGEFNFSELFLIASALDVSPSRFTPEPFRIPATSTRRTA